VVRVLSLAAALFVALGIGAGVAGVAEAGPPPGGVAPPPAPAAAALGATLLFCMLVAAVFAWLTLRSRLSGWGLMAAVFLAYFGLGTFLFQIESVVFLPKHLPPGFVGRLFVMGGLTGLLFAPAAAFLLGRRKRAAAAPGSFQELPLDTAARPPAGGSRAFALRIAGLALVYVALYFLAGYFIAFRNPELVAYYDDAAAPSFLDALLRLWTTRPWLFAFQALRGALFVAFVLPFLLSFRGSRLELSLIIGCAYAVWAFLLLTPNPYMPESVRISHFFEVMPSNFAFGVVVGAALSRFRTAGVVIR
jgi:hypothetical protein